jgi:Mg-chelatase subunit ChlD
MPDLVNEDGTTVAPSLTKEELDVLAENGVEFDLSDDDGSETPDSDSGEAIPDESGDESVEDVESEGDSADGGESEPEPGESDEDISEGDTSSGGEDPSGADAGEPEIDPASEAMAEMGMGDESDSSGDAEGGGESADGEADPDADGEIESAEVGDVSDEDGDDGLAPDEVTGEMDEMEHTIEPDDELVEEMDDRDRDEEMRDKFDIDVDEVHRTDERDIERWHRLVNQLNEYGTDVEQRKRERDERIGSIRVRESADDIEQRAHNSGAVSELKDGFRELVSRPTPRPETIGPQIDPYNVARRASGDMTIQDLFQEHVEVETGERCVGLATDISGSMRSDITDLKVAGGVIAEATEIIGDEFVWEAFTDRKSKGHTPSEERLDLRIVTGPDEEFDWEHVDSFTDSYNEPTAAGVRDCRMLMEQTQARQYVMIVITDGVTLVEEDGTWGGRGGGPVDHARRAVEECRQDGFEVIGLGIGGMDEEKMEEQFGTDQQGNPNYRLTTIDELAEDILEIYRSQMNVSRR